MKESVKGPSQDARLRKEKRSGRITRGRGALTIREKGEGSLLRGKRALGRTHLYPAEKKKRQRAVFLQRKKRT